MPRPLWRLAGPLLRGVAIADLGFERAHSRTRRLLGGFLASVLDGDEMVDRCTRLYERRGVPPRRELFEWEEAWIRQHFRPAPARVLVGGAGYGRECRALFELGYDVRAYEPSHEAASACRAVARCAVGTHEDLARAVDGETNACHGIASERYDAVLLGWGSLSHVLDPAQREATIVACTRLTDGPILASCRVSEGPLPEDRWVDLGNWFGERLGGRRPPPGLHYQPIHGFAATLRPAELERIARRTGRHLVRDRQPGVGITSVAFIAR